MPTPAATAAPGASARFDGDVLLPGDDGYETERLGWNRTIDARPAIIAAAAGPRDVQAAVLAAHEHDLPLAVQATGHGTVVAADGALLLKTSRWPASTSTRTAGSPGSGPARSGRTSTPPRPGTAWPRSPAAARPSA